MARRTLANLSAQSSAAGSYLAQQYDIAGLLASVSAAQQVAASMPKLDIAGLLSSVSAAQQVAASMPKHDVSGLAYLARATEPSSDDETESNEDEETEED